MSNKCLSSPGCIGYFLACRCWALHTVFEIFHFLMKNEGHWHAPMTLLWINEIMHVRRAGCSQTGVHRDLWDFCEFPKAVLNWMTCKAHHKTLQLTFKHASRCLQCWCLGLVQLPCVTAAVNLESGETNLPSAMPVHDQASQSPAWSGRSLWNSPPSRRAVDEC